MTDQRSPTPEQVFGARLRDLRQQHLLSQRQVAEAMVEQGFSWRQTTAAKTEAAERPVPIGEAVALARLFGTTVSDLTSDGPEVQQGVVLRNMLRARMRLQEATRAVEEATAAREEAMKVMREQERKWQAIRAARAAGEEPEPEGSGMTLDEVRIWMDVAAAPTAAPAQGDKEAGDVEHQ